MFNGEGRRDLRSVALCAVKCKKPCRLHWTLSCLSVTGAGVSGQKLDQLAALADKSAGLISFGVNQQIGRPNFYSLVEIWRDNASYQTFVNAASTQALLTRIQPLLEAPFDERPGTLVE